MRALDRKLLRDLARTKGQALTIALVMAAGIAAFVTLRGTLTSLELARRRYYEEQRFADVFAELEHAPESVGADLERIAGVARARTRIVQPAMIPLEDVAEPLRAVVASVGPDDQGALDRLDLSEGRSLDFERTDEGLLLASFARERRIRPGDELPVVQNGKLREVRIVGLVRSPEYVFPIAAGETSPDPERFAVVWMSRAAVEAIYELEGAFNSIELDLSPEASEPAVIDAVDRMLEPYGGLGAYGRAQQPSNRAIEGELMQLRSYSTILPLVFLLVAALLVHVVLSRVVYLQRPEIATLKAVGYTDLEVGLHFFELAIVIAALGGVVGVVAGAMLGGELVELYGKFFTFPNLRFTFDAKGASAAVAVSFAAALLGAFGAVRRVVSLAPAEAMRPPAPARYRRSVIDRLGLARAAGPSLHMIVRELERRPFRTLFSALAISASVALMLVGGWYYDGIRELVYTQFEQVMREDLTVAFVEPRPERAIRELAAIPGVTSAEGLRAVPVRFRSGHVTREGVVWGYPELGELRELRDRYARRAPLPPEGMVITDVLARILDVSVGESVEVEVREGRRDKLRVVVAGTVDEPFGLQGHMASSSLERLLGETPLASVALLRIDPERSASIDARLKELPHVASVTRRVNLLRRFEEQSAKMIATTAMIVMAFAATITVGVVYNDARVALSMRARDLASLRVLGFRRREISAILLGELALPLLVAIPVGLVLGRWLVQALASSVDPEQWRMPIVLLARTYAAAALLAIVAAVVSALLVRRRLDRLDLIAVLKTRE